jgi:DNA repair protein RadC
VHTETDRLGDVELLGLLLGAPGRSTAAALLDRFGSVAALARAEEGELCAVRGIGPLRAARLRAAFHLGRRSLCDAPTDGIVVDAGSAFAHLGPALVGLGHEELHALYLDRRRRPVAHRRLTKGSDRFTVVDPRQIFRPAVALGSAAVVLAHNHPSGDPTPSSQDREVTRRVAAAGRVIGVDLLDHLVIAGEAFVSLRERGELGGPEPLAAAWTA